MKRLMAAMVVMFLFAIQAIYDVDAALCQPSVEANDIDGEWVGVVDGLDGKKLEVKYRFKAVKTQLLGVIESRLGKGQISEGKIDGKDIEFKLNTGEFIILNEGTLSGDEIHITQTVGGEKIKYVLKGTLSDDEIHITETVGGEKTKYVLKRKGGL